MNILLPLLAAAAATPQPSDLKLFADWTVGCDNGLACQAVALMPEGQPEGSVTMSFRRGAEAGARPEISFAIDEGEGARLEADGASLPGRLVTGPNGPRVAPADLPALIAAFRSARALRIVGGNGTELGKVSLAGASAALLYMDEKQRRLGTVTALARPGSRPEAAVPPPPALPLVSAPPATRARPIAIGPARIKALREQHGCTIGQVGGPDSADVHALDANRSLILLGCGSGAYNVTHVPFVAERRGGTIRIAPAAFDVKPDWWEGGKPLLINAGWDSSAASLSSYSKGRGLGDCGTSSVYSWDGARFRLTEQSEMGECRGSIDYITTWRARVVRR